MQGLFAKGQLYTAVSRVRDFGKLRLTRTGVKEGDKCANEKVLAFEASTRWRMVDNGPEMVDLQSQHTVIEAEQVFEMVKPCVTRNCVIVVSIVRGNCMMKKMRSSCALRSVSQIGTSLELLGTSLEPANRRSSGDHRRPA